MKKNLRSALRGCTALLLALCMAAPPVFAAAEDVRLQTETQLSEGLVYVNTVQETAAGRVESFALELSPDSGVRPVLVQASQTVYGLATVNRAVSDARAQGLQVLGAINADYFSTASGVPIGIVIEKGVYRSSPEDQPALTFTDSRPDYVPAPEVMLSLHNNRTAAEVRPQHLNKWRSERGGMYLLNEDFSTVSTRTSTPGWFVRMKLVGQPEALTVNSTLQLEVTELVSDQTSLVIGEGEYILTADDQSEVGSVFASFRLGDRITLKTSCTDPVLSKAQYACGYGDLMVENGEMTDPSSWQHADQGRAPRTALGVKADGSLLLYAVDGRQSGYSEGMSQKVLARQMLEEGCVWAVNLDGGGSTAMSVLLPGQSEPAVQNRPSDGKPRSGGTYLLLVRQQEQPGQPARLAPAQNGIAVLAGTSVSLPDILVTDEYLNLLDARPGRLMGISEKGLGSLNAGVYTAGRTPGTDTIRLRDRETGIEGTMQIHVVPQLTQISLRREGEEKELTSLAVTPGEQVRLSVVGSYWGRQALHEPSQITWQTDGFGSVDETGLFTATDKGGSGTVTAAMGGLECTVPVKMKNVHLDVPEGHWAYGAVSYCYENGIVGGVSTTQYGADESIRRGDFMLMLYNAAGAPAVELEDVFTDVKSTDYYARAILWGYRSGLASGTGGGAFSPQASITREQAFTILRLALPVLGKDCPTGSIQTLERFPDHLQIANYAKGHVATLVEQGLVSGKTTGIDPQGVLTRAEMAVVLRGALTFTPKTEVPETPENPNVPDTPEVPDIPQIPEVPDAPEAPEEDLQLNMTGFILMSGGKAALSVNVTPAPGEQVVWSSSRPSAAAVDENGMVTNLYAGVGSPTVVITASYGGKTAQCQVTCSPAGQVGVVTDAQLGLNVRSGPGTDHPVAGKLADGARVLVLETLEGWYRILFLNSDRQAAEGFVSSDYLVLTAN